jgi:hypothetical protein
MRVRHGAAVLLALTAGCAGGDLLACGDKFLVVSRGTRFERAPLARQNVGILLYANPASDLPRTIARLSVEATLRKAGYRPLSVANIDELDTALRAGGWELVVVDLADAPAASARVEGTGAPLVLPVAHHSTRAAIAEAKKRYTGVIDAPARGTTFVDAIDEALERKVKARAKTGAAKSR